MSKRNSTRPTSVKSFRVGYFLEQGFVIDVQAASATDAERMISDLLDRDADELPGSERVHCDYGVLDAEEVRS